MDAEFTFRQIKPWLPEHVDFVLDYGGVSGLRELINQHYSKVRFEEEGFKHGYDIILALGESVFSVEEEIQQGWILPATKQLGLLRPDGRLFIDLGKGRDDFLELTFELIFDAVLHDDGQVVRCVFTKPATESDSEWRSVIKERK